MNKENKKKAQERRAQERERAEKAAKWKSVLPMLLGVVIVALGAVGILTSGRMKKNVPLQTEVTQSETQQAGAADSSSAAVGTSAQTEGDGSYALFDASALKGCWDISSDKLTYVQINVKDYGTITVALDETIAPESVKNFVALAKDGFYDGLTFHRIIDGFMIQGGAPKGTAAKTIKGEFSSNGVENPIKHVKGVISMARAKNPDSASSQFFIMVGDAPHLDGNYAAFGRVTEGYEIAERIAKDARPTDNNGTIRPEEQPVIEKIVITD